MRIGLNQINQYLSTKLSAKQLEQAFSRTEVEVEEVIVPNQLDPKIIVAQIIEAEPIEGSDRLKLCRLMIDPDAVETIEVVCGASNARAGIRVAFAQVGSELPGGFKITKRKIFGQVSSGMICGADELGLADQSNKIIELTDIDVALGTPVATVFDQNVVFDISLPSNRWDYFSLIGLAREVSAYTSAKLVLPKIEQLTPKLGSNLLNLQVKDQAELVAGLVLDIEPGVKSPDWLVESLLASGIRSINLVVDISNFVMIETGQPSHCFDYQKLKGGVEIRFAQDGETLITLDGSQLELTSQDLILADQSGPISLAGVMGGLSTAVDQDTTKILLEMVSWNPATIRRQSFRHGLRSEASTRFEKGLPSDLIRNLAMARAVSLFEDLANAKLISELEFDRLLDSETRSLDLDFDKISKLLGLDVSLDQVASQLDKLTLSYDEKSGQIEIPWWRGDILMSADLAEEIIKLVGLGQIPIKHDKVVNHPDNPSDQLLIKTTGLREKLVGRGLVEVLNYSLVSQSEVALSNYLDSQHLEVANPVSSTHKYFRADLLPGILVNLADMVRPDLDNQALGIFEIGNVFIKEDDGLSQRMRLAIGISGQNSLLRARQELENLMINSNLNLQPTYLEGYLPNRVIKLVDSEDSDKLIGWLGQINQARLENLGVRDQEVSVLELDLEEYYQSFNQNQIYASPYPYQLTKRDLTLQIYGQDLDFATIKDCLKQLDFVVDVSYQGDYYHQDSRALTLRLYLDTGSQPNKQVISEQISTIEVLIWEKFRVKIE